VDLGVLLSIFRPIWWLADRVRRPGLSLSAVYSQSIDGYILEIRSGPLAVTLAGAGVASFPRGLDNKDFSGIWAASGVSSTRLQGFDTTYYAVFVPPPKTASYAWAYAAGSLYQSPIAEHKRDKATRSRKATSDELAKLFNTELQRMDLIKTKRRVVFIEAQVAVLETRAAYEAARRKKKLEAQRKPPDRAI
jgi:hypothetical protein